MLFRSRLLRGGSRLCAAAFHAAARPGHESHVFDACWYYQL